MAQNEILGVDIPTHIDKTTPPEDTVVMLKEKIIEILDIVEKLDTDKYGMRSSAFHTQIKWKDENIDELLKKHILNHSNTPHCIATVVFLIILNFLKDQWENNIKRKLMKDYSITTEKNLKF